MRHESGLSGHWHNNQRRYMPKKLNSPTAYGIWRGIRCWNVTVQRKGVRYIRQFPDDLFGGQELAFRAAQSCRDALVQEHPPEPRIVKASKIRVNNKSGVAGVSVTHDAKGNPLAGRRKPVSETRRGKKPSP